MKFIVTAGGLGKKLWPYSRKSYPKQFQNLIGQKSLFGINIESLLEGYSAQDILVSTKKRYVSLVMEQAPQIPIENLILEPDIAKDRGPAEGFVFVNLFLRYPDEPFMIVQSDDLRVPNENFLKTIEVMDLVVRRDKKYITGGIKSSVPVMGNDYMQLEDRVEAAGEVEIFKTAKFLGRSSDYEATKKVIEDPNVVIHANHGCWYPDLMLKEYEKYKPSWFSALMKIKGVLESGGDDNKIDAIYSEMDKGPTEEVTKNIMTEGYVALLPFKWVDIGTWGSYYEFFAKKDEVYGDGNIVSIDSENSLVKTKDPKKLVVLHNVRNLMVIDSGDALMILPREDGGKVNKIVEELELKGLEDFI